MGQQERRQLNENNPSHCRLLNSRLYSLRNRSFYLTETEAEPGVLMVKQVAHQTAETVAAVQPAP